MATLNTLLVNGNSVNGTRNWDTNMDYLNIDEAIASADGNAIIDNTNGSSTQTASFLLSSVNADFLNMNSLSWRIRRRVSGAQTNERTLLVRIVTETAGVVLAAANSGGTFTSLGIITNTTFANVGPTAFAYVNTTATKAQWDDARIEFQNSVNKVHGGDANGLEIDSVELTGTYTSNIFPISGTINILNNFNSTIQEYGNNNNSWSGISADGNPPTFGQIKVGVDLSNGLVTSGITIAEFSFWLKKTGSPDYKIKAEIWSVSTNGFLTNLEATSSNIIEATSLTASFQKITFLFTGQVLNSSISRFYFCIAIDGNIITGGFSNRIDIASNDAGGNNNVNYCFVSYNTPTTLTSNPTDVHIEIKKNGTKIALGVLKGKGQLVGTINAGTLATINYQQLTQNTSSVIDSTTKRQGTSLPQKVKSVSNFKSQIGIFGAPTGLIIVGEIWEWDGATTVGSLLATSTNSFNETDLPDYLQFDFNEGNYNTPVVCVVRVSSATLINASNYIHVQIDASGGLRYYKLTTTDDGITWNFTSTWEFSTEINFTSIIISGILTYAPSQIDTTINALATTSGTLIAKGFLSGAIWCASTDSENEIYIDDPSNGGINLSYGYGQVFLNFNSRITEIGFELYKTGSPISDIRCEIWSLDGSNLPLERLFVSPTIFQSGSLATSPTEYTFNGGNQFYNQKIAVVVIAFNKVVDSGGNRANTIFYLEDLFPNTNYISLSSGGSWSSDPSRELHIRLTLAPFKMVEGVLIDQPLPPGSLEGITNASATTISVLSAKGSLGGSSNGSATTEVTSITLKVDADINGVATVTGLLHADAKGFGVSNGVATTSATLIAKGDLDDAVDGISSVTGVLSGKGGLAGIINGDTTTISVLTSQNVPITGIINGIATVSATLTAIGTLQGVINAVATVDGTASARADLSVVINISITVTGTLTADGELAGTSNGISSIFGLLNSNLQGSVIVDTSTNTQGTLTGTGALSGTINGTSTTSANVGAIQPMEGESNGIATTSGTLTANGSLIGTINGSSTEQGTLTANATLLGESNGVASVSGTLSANGNLSGSSNGNATTSGNTNANAQLLGEINGIASVNGTLSANGFLVGISNGSTILFGLLNSNLQGEVVVNTDSMVEGTLTGNGLLIGIINSSTTITGLIGSTQPIEGEINGTSTVTGVLNGQTSILGISNGVASVSGTLTALGQLQGSINTSTNITGSLVSDAMLGVSNGIASVSGTLTAKGALIGTSNGSATVEGILTNDAVFGISNGVATVSGTLTAKGSLVGSSNGETTIFGILNTKLLSSITGIATVTGTLIANGSLIGISNGNTTVTGVLNAKGNLEGIINGTTDLQGVLVSDAMFGASNGSTTINGTLTAIGSLSGIVLGQTVTDGSLISDAMAGITDGTATTQGTLSGNGSLVGIINGTTTISGAIQLGLTGTIDTLAIVTGTLTSKGLLSGASDGSSLTSGVLTSPGVLEGQTDGSVIVNGTLTAKGYLVGIINSATTVEGILISDAISGISNGSSTVSGTLTGTANLAGVIVSITTVQGTLSSNNLAGTTDGSSDVTGTLTPLGFTIGVLEGEIFGESLLDLCELTGIGSLNGASNGTSTTSSTAYSGYNISGVSNGSTTITATLMGWGALAGISQEDPIYFDLGTGSLIAKFFTFDESYGETLIIRKKAVQYIEFMFGAVGSPDFLMRAEIWSLNGSRLPDTLLQTSINTIQASSVVVGLYQYYRFNFNPINVSYDEEVAIVVHIYNHTVGDGSNYVERIYGDNNPFPQGNIVYNFTGALWSENLDQDINGRIQLVKKVTGTIVGTMYGITNGSSIVTGYMESFGPLFGVSNGSSSAQGILSHKINGSSSGTTIVLGTLTGTAHLIGDANGSSTVIGTVLSDGTMLGEVNNSSFVSGTLLGKVQMNAESNASATVNGILSGIANLVGAIQGTSTVTLDNLGSIGKLIGVINNSSTVTGSMLNQNQGLSNGSTVTSGTLTAIGSLTGTSNGSTLVQGTFLSPIEGTSNGSSNVTGALTAIGNLFGEANGISILFVMPYGLNQISGTSNGITIVTGTLRSVGVLEGIINVYSQTSGTLVNLVDNTVKIYGTANGSSSVIGYMTDSASGIMDTSCFYEVIYLDLICYEVVYEYKKYIVNYNCKI